MGSLESILFPLREEIRLLSLQMAFASGPGNMTLGTAALEESKGGVNRKKKKRWVMPAEMPS